MGANRRSGEEAIHLYESAISRVQSSLILNPRDPMAFLIWGNILSERALRTEQTSLSYQLNRMANRKYQSSFDCDPNCFELLYNWGNTLLQTSRISPPEERAPFLLEAADRYHIALSLLGFDQTQQRSNVLRNWGVVLSKLGRLQPSHNKAKVFFDESENKFVSALNQITTDGEIYFELGNVCYHSARSAASSKQYKPAFDKLVAAGEWYMQAIRSNSGYTQDAITNWGTILNLQAHLSEIDQPDDFSLLNPVQQYLGVLQSVLTDEENTLQLSLKPVLGLTKAHHELISQCAFNCLRKLAHCDIPTVTEEAQRALRIAEKSLPAEIRQSTLKKSDSQTSASKFLQKLQSTPVTSLLRSQDTEAKTPALTDFQRLSNLSSSESSCTVCLKGTVRLFVLKVRQAEDITRDSSTPRLPWGEFAPPSPPRNTNTTRHEQFTRAMMRILKGRMPFLAQILYSYRKDDNYYFIQEYVSDDRALYRLRQTGEFKKHRREGVYRTLSRQPLLPEQSVTGRLRSSSVLAENTNLDRPKKPRKSMLARTSSQIHARPVIPMQPAQSVRAAHPPREPLPESIAQFYIAEIIILFGRLHSLGFVYGNLTPTTVHLDADGHICLTRFLFLMDGTSPDDEISTIAPEVMTGEPFRKASDWWSVGALLHEFLTSDMPQCGASAMLQLCTPRARSLISGLLEVDPQKRLGVDGVEQIKNHEFFRGFDWARAESRKLPPPLVFDCENSTTGMISIVDENVFRAPTIVAQLQETEFHQHSLVTPDE